MNDDPWGLPKVRVLGTGGTISYVCDDRLNLADYVETGTTIGIEEILARVPEVHRVARIEAEQFCQEDFVRLALGPNEWPGLAHRCNELFRSDPDLAGIAITHGSAFLEETAFFLSLTVKDRRPVVLTASQRPASGLSTDADVNLYDAVRVAAAPQSRGRGALVVLNNEIHAARDATKSNTFRVETFHPKELGFLGYADSDGQVVYYRSPERRHTVASELAAPVDVPLPRVEILYVYAGADDLLVDLLVGRGVAGLVVATSGGGSMPPAFRDAVARAAERGLPVVLSSRAGNGRVVERAGMRRRGFVVADNLSPQKARILLMLGLLRTNDGGQLQELFNTH